MSEDKINVEEGVRVIKKYPNRRIYDTHTSRNRDTASHSELRGERFLRLR